MGIRAARCTAPTMAGQSGTLTLVWLGTANADG